MPRRLTGAATPQLNQPIAPQLPFVWPEPRVSAGTGFYAAGGLPFDVAAQAATHVFGVASGIDARAVDWMEGYLSNNSDTKLRLVISIYPACQTSTSDLECLLRLAARHGDRAAFRIFPEASLLDRSSNLLCICGLDGEAAVVTGPTENIGFAPTSPSQANLASLVSAPTLEACRTWFDYLWSVAGELDTEMIAAIPRMKLPEGDPEAALLWEDYRQECFKHGRGTAPSVRTEIDPESGEMVLMDQNDHRIPSPTEAIGIPKLDGLAQSIARVYSHGLLVSIDKLSRVPPLEAPVKPSWFGVESFRQRGMVSARTSMKVAPFDESTLKKIERLRRASGELLPRFSFALADGTRWVPKQAIPLFEQALTAANEEAKELLGKAVDRDVESFLLSQRDRIRADAQEMYTVYHPGGKIPDDAVQSILDELKARLDKTRANKLIPTMTYSSIAFNPLQSSEWSSPWSQAFALLRGIAEFPRAAMTNRFFWQGLHTNEDALVGAMNVAGDDLVAEYGSRKAMQRAEEELQLIKRLEGNSADPQDKCRALWTLITTGQRTEMESIIGAA